VVFPSTPLDAKGLMKSAIRSNNPIIFLEHKNYGQMGVVPSDEYLIAIGSADIKRKGEDVTIITYGRMVDSVLQAAKVLEDDEVSVEVVDLRSLRPLDTATILESVRKTKRAIVVHEAPLFGGFGGEVVSSIVSDEKTFSLLLEPVKRLGGKEMPTPFNKQLESMIVPQIDDIVNLTLSLFD
jgi:pyruvate dehydrogenase E1 component beta subunit